MSPTLYQQSMNQLHSTYANMASVGREGLLTDKSVPVEKKRCPGTREEQVLANGAVWVSPDRRPRPKNESVLRLRSLQNRTWLPLSLLNKRQSHRLNANWLNCTLEFSRRKTYLLGERWKKDLLICLFTRRNSKTLLSSGSHSFYWSYFPLMGSMLQPYPFTLTHPVK